MDHLDTVKAYLKAIENGATGDALDAFYAPDVHQTEYPNRLVPNGVARTLNDLKDGSIKGASISRKQTFEIQKLYSHGNIVILEAIWTSTFNIPIGSLQPGDEMKAYFAQFYEFNEEGKIIRQRNYDCFEPF